MTQDADTESPVSPVSPVSPARPSLRTLRMDSFASRHARLAAVMAAIGARPDQVVLPAEGMVEGADGLRLHYLEWPGPTSEPMLLFLHGGGLHAHSFDAVGPLLRETGRCVALDLRGHGESDRAGDYDPKLIARDIDAVVAAFAPEKVVVVAHSLGGIAALLWAGTRPSALAGLVIVDIAPDVEQDGGQAVANLISQRPGFADLEEAEAFLTGAVPTARDAATSGISLTLTWDDRGLLTWKHDPVQFEQPAAVAEAMEHLWAATARVAVPTLVLRGARSRVLSPAAAAALAAHIPDGRWQEVPNAGHTIQTGNPRALADIVTAFLAELPPA